MSKRQESSWQKLKRYTLNLFLVLAVGLVSMTAIYALYFNKEDAFIAGYKPYVISSDSMAPIYRKNSIVLVKQGNFKTIKTGEKIAFKVQELEGKPAFHRVVAVTPEGVVTKGDANKIRDAHLVTDKTYLGHEVWHTNIAVTLLPLLKTPKGIIYLIVLPIILMILLSQTLKIIMRERRSKQLELADSHEENSLEGE